MSTASDDVVRRHMPLLWHGYFGVLVVTTAGVLLVDHAPGATYALLAGLAVWYLFPGPGTRHIERDDGPAPWPYLAGAVALLFPMAVLDPNALVLLFVLYPHCFALTRGYLEGVACAAVLSVVSMGAVGVGQHASGWDWAGLAVQGVVYVVFACAIGGMIIYYVEMAQRRGELLEQLRAARAEAKAAHHEAGVLAERARLAGEIHDTIAQGFTSILMLTQAADAAAERPEVVRARLASIERTARENLTEARALVAALGPVDLRGSTLTDALRRLVDRFATELGVSARLEVSGEPSGLDANRQVALLRAAQEALANVRKHAAARQVVVRLAGAGDAGGTLLEVRDDGRGFTAGSSDGFGLAGMRERVAHVGGEVEVESAPGVGTTVRVRVP